MKNTKNNKNITCRIVSTGTIMHVNTIDEILSPGHYKIDACGVTVHDGFPDGVDEECLSAYLEVSDTNHSNDNLKSAAVGQTLSCTNASGVTAAYYRSAITKNGMVEWNSWVNLGAATTTDIQDGSVTAAKLSADIRPNVENPLRPLFIAAGAEYNDTGADKTKTAPWGEAVIHKAGHYYLNGLGDITEEQMTMIYNRGLFTDNDYAPFGYQHVIFNKIRTNLGRVGISNASITGRYMSINNQTLEVLMLNVSLKGPNAAISVTNSLGFVLGSIKLRIIDTSVKLETKIWESNAFGGCVTLEEVRINNLQSNIIFSDSSLLSKASVLFMIQNATPTSAITITLHPDAYARLADDADIVAALEAQPLISLVSA